MLHKLCQSYGCPRVALPGESRCPEHKGNIQFPRVPESARIAMMQFANANPHVFCQAEGGCSNWVSAGTRFCSRHLAERSRENKEAPPAETMADKYPKYYKAIPKDWDSVDTYGVNKLFPVDDPSGAILHARKKLLIPGSRTGGKSMRKDITEARDALNRWLELNPE